MVFFFFFFQAEDGIRDYKVTGVQTCALPIYDGEADIGNDKGKQRAQGFQAGPTGEGVDRDHGEDADQDVSGARAADHGERLVDHERDQQNVQYPGEIEGGQRRDETRQVGHHRLGINGPSTILTRRRGRAAHRGRISSTADTMDYAFRSGTRRHRRDPRRAHRSGGGRRRPGKRRRPHDRGGAGDAGDRQFHGGAGTRADLSGADPGALRLPAPAADEPDQHFHVRDGILRIDRRARRGDHGDLGGGSHAHHSAGGRSGVPGGRPGASGAHVPAARQGRRGAGARRADGGERGSGAPGRSQPSRRDLRNHERRWDDGAGTATGGVLQAP